ncbi:hypothetical protein K469DRAFT_619047 [Zopfia rhizophila CBS 207.26]|uniref:Uncharacterized protein n=1 Tax=Zopfia rhizophila CBS 207.26 TaxID=1314779 RepID=A0A6A6ESJ5_9PEZI|nr:hypothetical protein K469DRAFT_619047 [Zopfia rhizophila CBS 207.26]
MVSASALLLFAASAIASPLVQRQTEIPEDWNWQVEGWHAGCARSGCSYNFNITVPTIEGEIGGVKAYCSGYENGAFFIPCQILEGVNNGVAAKLLPREDESGRGPQQFAVSFLKASYEGSPYYNFTAYHETIYNAFVAPLQNFTMTPTEVFGVA